MYKVGIIGGIGSGKSTVAKYFAQLGICVIEADDVIRSLTSKKSHIFQDIIKYFGDNALDKEGNLNRNYIKNVIFKNDSKKKWLENLLHPLAYKEMEKCANESKSPYAILVIPLLIESPPPHKLLDRILLVTSSPKTQIERIKKRDQSNTSLIKAIISSQTTENMRHAIADDVIKNDIPFNELENKIKQLHKKYLKLSSTERRC